MTMIDNLTVYCLLVLSIGLAVVLAILVGKILKFQESFKFAYNKNALATNAQNRVFESMIDKLDARFNEVDVNVRSVQSVVDAWFNEKSGLANGMKEEVGNLSGQVAASQIVVTEKVKELKELVKSIDVKHDGVTGLFASAVDSISEDVAAIGLVVSGPAKGKPGRKPKAEKGAKAPKVSKK